MEENEKNISFVEEPLVSYCTSSLNQGVCAIFSNRKSKSFRHTHFSFTPTNTNNNKFSLCNTIMLPFITNETLNKEENYMKNKSNRLITSKDTLFSLKKENTKLKLDISKEENIDINDDKNINNIILEKKESNNGGLYGEDNFKEKKSPMEINPFFLGKTFSFNINNNNNIKPIKNAVNSDQLKDENNNEKNDDLKGFLNREKSKSVFYADERIDKKNSIQIKEEDDDKSEKIGKKNNKMKSKNSFLNIKSEVKKDKEKQTKQRGFKRKITFNMETKFTKREKEKNKTLDKEQNKRKEKSKDKEKEDSIKKKKDKDKDKDKDKGKNKDLSRTNFKYNITIDKRRQSYYFSNKCITNTFNINFFNTIKKNRLDNSSVDEKNLRKKNTKRKNKLSKTKDEVKKNKSNNKYKTYSQSKGIASLKEYIKIKELNEIKNDNDSFSSRTSKSFEHKNIEVKNKRYNSKKEIKSINIKRKDSDSEKKDKKKQKIKRGRTFVIEEEEDEDNPNNKNSEKKMNDKKEEKDKEEKCKEEKAKKKSSTKQLVIKEKESSKDKDNNSDDKNKISKCLTADLRRKKNYSIFEKNLRGGKLSNSSKSKKGVGRMVMNLFGNNYKNKNDIDFEFALKNNLKKMQFNLFSKDKFTNTEFSDSDYLKYTLDCMELILDIDMEKQTRLKNKINFNFPKPKKNKVKKKIALFDLDETLVHCTGDIKNQKEKYQHKIEIKLPGKQAVEVGINLRPYWKETMNLIKKKYHIVIYTASHQAYADSVLDFMDPKKKYFKYRLYRNNCSLTDVDGSKFYIKDLDIFNEYYDLKDIVIIDNSVLSFAYHLHNGVPIVPYYDEDKDGSLYVVGLYLLHIFNEGDLREANKKQINLDSFLEEAKKIKDKEEEEYIDDNQIEEASDSKEDDNNENENENDNNNIDKKEENKENIDNTDNIDNIDNINNIEAENNNKGELSQKNSKKSIDSSKKTSEKEQKKFSEKKLVFGMKKKSSNFLCYIDHHNREEENDITQKKLMSQSKLINMYYEVKDKSPSSEHRAELPKSKLNNENKSNIKDNNSITKDKSNDNGNKATIIFVDNDEIDCKSDPGVFPYEQNNLSDIESSVEEKAKDQPVLTRMLTLFENSSFDNRKDSESIKENNKVKLGFIRSNFFNNFKI